MEVDAAARKAEEKEGEGRAPRMRTPPVSVPKILAQATTERW